MSQEIPQKIDAVLQLLFDEIRAAPASTCQRCGKAFGPKPAELCWDCDQADMQAQDRKRRALADMAAIDRRFRSATLDSYLCPPGDAEARRQIATWVATKGLYVYGQPGGGKSHLAYARVRQLVEQDGLRVFASEWTDLLQRMKATFDGRSTETNSDILAKIETADLVFIDDLMTGKPTEWAIEQAWSIVQARYQSERPLLITSNYTLGELADRIGGIDGARIVSRLAEMCDRLRVVAEDFRMGGQP